MKSMKWRAACVLGAVLAMVLCARGAFDPSGYACTARFQVAGYGQAETLANFSLLVKLGTNLPGFRYTQMRSART